MAIRLGNTCGNCDKLNSNQTCAVHEVVVSNNYTCNRFNMKASLNNNHDCSSCSRFKAVSCAHPQTATAGMLCESWAPQAVHV